MPTDNKQIHLDNRPEGEASASNFKLVDQPTRALADGQVLVRHHYLSLDPYMRGRMNDAKSYAQPQPLGQVMQGGTVGEVVEASTPSTPSATRWSASAAGRNTAWSTPRARRAAQGRHHARAAVALPRRGRHAGRHGLVRPGEDHQAEGRRDHRGQRRQRRGRQRLRRAGQGARLPRGRHRRRRGQVQLRGRRARLRRLHRLPAAPRREVAVQGAEGSRPNGIDGYFENVGGTSSTRCCCA